MGDRISPTERELIVSRMNVIIDELDIITDVYKYSHRCTEKGLVDILSVREKLRLLCLSIKADCVITDYKIEKAREAEKRKQLEKMGRKKSGKVK